MGPELVVCIPEIFTFLVPTLKDVSHVNNSIFLVLVSNVQNLKSYISRVTRSMDRYHVGIPMIMVPGTDG